MSSHRRASLLALLLALLAPLLTHCGLRDGTQTTPLQRAARTEAMTDEGASLLPGVTGVPTVEGNVLTGLTCFECHTPLEDMQGRVRFSHQNHTDRGLHCNQCHTAEDHTPVPADKVGIQHSWGVSRHCGACHDGNQAPDDCRTCHTAGEVIMPESHKRADFARGHGQDAPQETCLTCHTQRQCDNCHGLSLPHPAGFAASHGPMAKSQSELCGTCHTPSYCNDCHGGFPMPHPAGFIDVHGQHDQRQCSTCHTQRDCDSCHARNNPHPSNFGTTHGPAAKRDDPKCATCHTQSYCDSCHGLRLPHPTGFDTQHGAQAKSSPDSCAKCHQQRECDDCHGRPMPHPADYERVHGLEALGRSEDCGRCHTSNDCRDCHGATVPHPRNYIYGHAGEAKFGQEQPCVKCHQSNYCEQCHTPEQLAGEAEE